MRPRRLDALHGIGDGRPRGAAFAASVTSAAASRSVEP